MSEAAFDEARFWGELPQSFADIDAPGFWDQAPQPLNWRVLIMPDIPKPMSEGGILLPEQTQEAEQFLSYIGRIITVGSLAFSDERLKREANKPQVGDYVLFGRYAGQVVKYKNIRLLLVNDDEILAVTKHREALKVHM